MLRRAGNATPRADARNLITPGRQPSPPNAAVPHDLAFFLVQHVFGDVAGQVADAAQVLPGLAGPLDFALIDCEKDDYIRFFEMIPACPGTVVVADNILSHGLTDYVAHVRSRGGVESVTLAIGKGLEVTVYAG